MKKIIMFIMILILVTGCFNKNIKSQDSGKNNEESSSFEEVKEEYIDKNPIKLGFYNKNSNTRNLITSYNCKWIKFTDMAVINVFPTNETNLPISSVKSLWQNYWSNYVNKNYKFGIEISYSLTSGEKIDLTVLKHSDNNPGFNYIQMYIYDGYNATTSWYDHLEDDEFTTNTVFTSIKLTASVYIEQVTTPINLKVFTYDSSDDFDENNHYRGDSYTTVIVNKTN